VIVVIFSPSLVRHIAPFHVLILLLMRYSRSNSRRRRGSRRGGSYTVPRGGIRL